MVILCCYKNHHSCTLSQGPNSRSDSNDLQGAADFQAQILFNTRSKFAPLRHIISHAHLKKRRNSHISLQACSMGKAFVSKKNVIIIHLCSVNSTWETALMTIRINRQNIIAASFIQMHSHVIEQSPIILPSLKIYC